VSGVIPNPRARYAAKREAILAAASKVFTDRGLSGFTLAAVAKRMDLHPVSLTYYFKRKEDLAAACVLHTLERFGDMLSDAEVGETPQERLRRFVHAYFAARRRVAEGQEAQLVPFGEVRLFSGPDDDRVVEAYGAFLHRVGLLLKEPVAPLSGGRRRALAHLVINQLCWSDTWLGAYHVSDYPRVAERIADIMVGGLAAPGRVMPPGPLLELGSPHADNDEVTREAFLVAATELINREGYRGASVDKISARLNVTKGSFYHHNTDKDDLALACFERSFEIVAEAMRKAETGKDGWERLWLAACSLAVLQATGEHGRMLRHTALAALPVDGRKAVMARYQQVAHSFAGLISDGVADGSIRPVDPLLAAQMVMIMFNSTPAMEFWSPGSTRETVIETVRASLMGFFAAGEPDA
jgi:AcrR family transcriptional regulator